MPDEIRHSLDGSPLHMCIIKITFGVKKEQRSVQIIRMEITRSSNRMFSHLRLVDLYQNMHS